MWNARYHRAGWRRGWHGSPFGLLLGFILFAAILKSGIWLPLLGLGLAFAFIAFACSHGGCNENHPFGEKPKRGGFGPWYGPVDPHAEKPKRDFDDEYV